MDQADEAGKIVVIAAVKGGVGRTTIAANVAAALHHQGQRVCLVDLDLEFGDIALSLKLDPVRTLVDAVEADIPDDTEDPLDLLKTEFLPGFNCILAPIDPRSALSLPQNLIADLLPALAETYDYVVVDTSAHQTAQVSAALWAADRILLVATPDFLNAKALRQQNDLLDLIATKAERSLLINREPGRKAVASGASAFDLSSVIGSPLAASLPDTVDVPRSILQGRPLVLEDPGHPFSMKLHELVTGWLPPADSDRTDLRQKRPGLRKRKK
ncbi:AAA family ATPase [Aeromicrobium sp.]|uniref:AAA family ATPase n=1 Tax=Aeromicrobium sp. TaxID=1871063 RepID=UPI002FC600FA